MIAKIETPAGHDRTAGKVGYARFGVQRIDRTDHQPRIHGVPPGLLGIERVF